jgi:hypothetical protein
MDQRNNKREGSVPRAAQIDREIEGLVVRVVRGDGNTVARDTIYRLTQERAHLLSKPRRKPQGEPA